MLLVSAYKLVDAVHERLDPLNGDLLLRDEEPALEWLPQLQLDSVVGYGPAFLGALSSLKPTLLQAGEWNDLPAARNGYPHPRALHGESASHAIKGELLAHAEEVGPPHPEVDHREGKRPERGQHEDDKHDGEKATKHQNA